ncbi:hypothetical protein DN582_17050 [Burkholderia multivorans]|nr:hypothetical protein DN582_17050 [Burkholderia multivorans]RAG64423.1 hypothetical protein DN490_13930 [Burkholderia multivorans]
MAPNLWITWPFQERGQILVPLNAIMRSDSFGGNGWVSVIPLICRDSGNYLIEGGIGQMDDGIEQEPRLLLVDTNCFLRIYHSSLRPFLGTNVGGYRILTLGSLLEEFRQSPRLGREYAWVAADLAAEEVNGALPDLPDHDREDVAMEVRQLRPYAKAYLERHCAREGIPPKSLSSRDLELLATAAVFEAVIASDEWPLKLIVEDLTSEDDYQIEIITSLHVLHMLEQAGCFDASERRNTVTSWLRCDEKLPRAWRELYQQLFGELAPTLQ